MRRLPIALVLSLAACGGGDRDEPRQEPELRAACTSYCAGRARCDEVAESCADDCVAAEGFPDLDRCAACLDENAGACAIASPEWLPVCVDLCAGAP